MVYVMLGVSESTRFGSYTRYLLNGLERRCFKLLAIRVAKISLLQDTAAVEKELAELCQRYAKLGIRHEALLDAAAIEVTVVDTPIASGQSAPALPASTKDAAMTTMPTDAVPEADEEPEIESLVELDFEDEDAERAYIESLADEEVVTRGDYAGLPKRVAAMIAAAVREIRAQIVTIQIHDPKWDHRNIVDCKFGVASTKISVRDIVEVIRTAQLEVWGLPTDTPDIRNAPHFILALKNGVRIRMDYRPEWDTYFGCWFKTNRTLPLCGLPAEMIFDLAIQALEKGSERLEREAAEGKIKILPPPWVALLEEGRKTLGLPALSTPAS
jgi:hypothetical protein